jgi:hypothetical protein
MPPPPTPSRARSSVAPSSRTSVAPSARSSVTPRNASIPLTPEEIVTLAELAVSHFRIRKRKGGAAKYFERVEDDLSKEIGRPFTSARQKVQKMVKEYRQKFNLEGSGTGVNSSEPEIDAVMRDLVELFNQERARTEANEADGVAAEKEARRVKRDRRNMLARASGKEVSSDEDLESGSSVSEEEDKTTDEDTAADTVANEDEEAVPIPARRRRTVSPDTSTSRGRGRARGNTRSGRKRPREEDNEADRSQMREMLEGMAADRELRRQELAAQREKDNASIELMKKLGDALIARMT